MMQLPHARVPCLLQCCCPVRHCAAVAEMLTGTAALAVTLLPLNVCRACSATVHVE